jgi:CubicO group peptidase (beta-lactamase class C family)
MQRFVRKGDTMNLHTGVIYIKENEQDPKYKFYGFREFPNKLEHNAQTRYPTASFGKIFTAVGILKLIEDGILSLESTLGETLSFDLHQIDKDVTIKQLLTHTSGVPDYCDEEIVPDYADLWKDYPNYKIRNSKDLLPLFIKNPMKYPKGERFEYNNSAFVLLGLIIEEITRMPFDEYIQRILFNPLNMDRSGYFELDRLPENCALGYIYDELDEEYHSFIYSIDVKGSGAGGAYTSPNDLQKFWQGLFEYKILSKETIDTMMINSTNWDKGGYGLGVWLDENNDPYIVGSDPGVDCISWYSPKTKRNITIISNASDDVYKVMKGLK